ncbi:glycine/D-amino acid oxidase-like deaminating enzyme [Bradyrhizobium sp. USDA 4486]
MPQGNHSWDIETDLLVIGAGAGGMTAALVATLEGLNVILCEKSDMVGGTTATSAGTVWIPGNRQGQRAGTPDTVESAKAYLAAMLGAHTTDERLETFLTAGPIVLDYLEQKTSVQFAAPAVHPDYKNLPGAAIGGRALGAIPFDGRKLGKDFARVRPPRREFMVLGGMMVGKADIAPLLAPFRSWANFMHVAGLLARHALDRLTHKRGTRLIMGNALVARLFDSVLRAGVEVRFERRRFARSFARARTSLGPSCRPQAERSPSVPIRVWCWRQEASVGARTFATGCFRMPPAGSRLRHYPTPATAFWQPRALTPLLRATSKARPCGCRVRL